MKILRLVVIFILFSSYINSLEYLEDETNENESKLRYLQTTTANTTVSWVTTAFGPLFFSANAGCASFGQSATAAAVEAAYNIKNKLTGKTAINISPQNLHDCKVYNGTTITQCIQFFDPMGNEKNITMFGFFKNTDYPWTGIKQSCNAKALNAIRPIRWEVSKLNYWVTNITSMTPQDAINLLKKGPFLFRSGFVLPSPTLINGIYKVPTTTSYVPNRYYYILLVVGHETDAITKISYWIVRRDTNILTTGNVAGYIKIQRDDANMNWGISSGNYARPVFD